MVNPYQSTNTQSGKSNSRRAVRRYAISAALLFPFAFVIGFPGFTLLNQEYDWLPTQSGIHDIQFNGQSVADATVIAFSTSICLVATAISILLLVVAFRNWQANRRLA